MSTFTMRSTLRDTIAEWDVKQGCDGRELETTKEALPLPEELRAGALGRPESSLPGSLSGPVAGALPGLTSCRGHGGDF